MAEDDRFYVKTLRMQNFRCFEDVELGPFDPHFNLLVGENGAGKSSVLVALANLYHSIATRSERIPNSLSLSALDTPFAQNDQGALVLSRNMLDIRSDFSAFGANFVASSYVNDSSENHVYYREENIHRVQAEKFVDRILGAVSIRSLLAFYTTDRRFRSHFAGEKDSPKRRRVIDFIGYVDWELAGASADALRAWFKDETLLALQMEQRIRENQARDNHAVSVHALGLVQDAVVRIVDGARKIWFDGGAQEITLDMIDGRVLPFAGLSDGQRALVGLVADVARRAWLLNGRRLGSKTLTETPGLVLIDEIDLHLHPKWQRQIVPALKKVFPKIQFFATTHSPQVIGECKPEEIVLLTPQGQKRPSGSYGRDSNWILEVLMEAEGRDPGVAARLKTLFDNIEDEKFDEARAEIEALRRDIGEGPEVVGAETFLWRMQHLGDEAAE